MSERMRRWWHRTFGHGVTAIGTTTSNAEITTVSLTVAFCPCGVGRPVAGSVFQTPVGRDDPEDMLGSFLDDAP